MIHCPTCRPPRRRADRRTPATRRNASVEERPQHPRNRRVHAAAEPAGERADGESAATLKPLACPGRHHLPMQKREKIDAQQIVGGELAGDRAERDLRRAQLLGEELERGRRRGEMLRGGREPRVGLAQRAQMALAARNAPSMSSCAPTSARISCRSTSTPAPVFAESQTCGRLGGGAAPPSSAGSPRSSDFGAIARRSILLWTTIRGNRGGQLREDRRVGGREARVSRRRVDQHQREVGAPDRRPRPLDAERLDRIVGRAQSRGVDRSSAECRGFRSRACTVSRVVPAIGVTIATSSPAS